MTLDAAGEVRFARPDGRPLPDAPALPAASDAPLAPVMARLDRAGIRIGPHTATPAWRGERLVACNCRATIIPAGNAA